MMLSVVRLKLVEEIIAGEVLSDTVLNYTFGEFEQICFVDVKFLEKKWQSGLWIDQERIE